MGYLANKLKSSLAPYIEEISCHSILSNTNTLRDVSFFMSEHVFLVWDFVCLIKKLHSRVVSSAVPWHPSEDPCSVRLISEILLEEESDICADGVSYLSHYEMYLNAMGALGADTSVMHKFLSQLSNDVSLLDALNSAPILPSTRAFVETTFSFFEGSTHEIAAAFVYGREVITPYMFSPLLNRLNSHFSSEQDKLDPLRFYLNRHIELDGDEHLPKSLQMLSRLADNDMKKWAEIESAAKKSLQARIDFLDGVHLALQRGCFGSHATGSLSVESV